MKTGGEFGRLLWKEYRQVRAFGFVLFGCGLALIALAIPSAPSIDPLFMLVLVMPILFAVAASATAFSGEHENGSFLFQRTLPASLPAIAGAKIGVAVGGSILMYLAFWVVIQFGWVLTGRNAFVDANLAGEFSNGLITLLEFLVFGTLFSLIDRRPLVSLAKATATVIAIRWIGMGTDVLFFRGFSGIPNLPWPSLSWRVGLLATGIGLLIPLSRKWYADMPIRLLPVAVSERLRPAWKTLRSVESVRRGAWRRLFWLQYRVAIWPLAIFTIVGASLALSLHPTVQESYFYPPIATLLLGAFAFRAVSVHRGTFAALAASPKAAWISQLVFPAVGCLSVVCAMLISESYFRASYPAEYFLPQFQIALYTGIAAFTWGQLASLRCSKVFSAVGLSIVFSIVALLWIILVVFANVPIWLFVLPVITYPLLESFLRTRRWLSDERQSKVWWLRRTALYVSLALGLIIYRAYEIPGVSNEQFARAQALAPRMTSEQTKRFREISDKLFNARLNSKSEGDRALSDSGRDSQWVRNHLRELTEILNSEFVCVALPKPPNSIFQYDLGRQFVIQQFLNSAFTYAVHTGDVALAERILMKRPMGAVPPNLDLLRWCHLPGNNSERIRDVARQTQDLFTDEMFFGHVLVGASYPFHHLVYWPEPRGEYPFFMRAAVFLAEGTRWNRRVRFETVRTDKLVAIIGEKIRNGMSVQEIIDWNAAKAVTDDQWGKDAEKCSEILFYYRYYSVWSRGQTLQLALVSWQMDHGGELPESLEELRGKYLERIPVEPNSGASFRLIRNRWPVPLLDPISGSRPFHHLLRGGDGKLPPFIWPPIRNQFGELPDQEFVNKIWSDSQLIDSIFPLELPGDETSTGEKSQQTEEEPASEK